MSLVLTGRDAAQASPLRAETKHFAEPATLCAHGPTACLSIPKAISPSVSFTAASVCPSSSPPMTASVFLSIPITPAFVCPHNPSV